MIHPLSDVKSTNIGEGTTVWQYAVILENAVIGEGCNINCHTFIENDVTVGNNVTVKSGIYLWDGIVIEDNVFLGPNVVFTNDLFPRSKQRTEFVKTRILEGSSLGANTTVLAGVTIGRYAMSGIASVITKDVPDHALVYGSPARIMGFVDELGQKLEEIDEGRYSSQSGDLYIKNGNGLKKI